MKDFSHRNHRRRKGRAFSESDSSEPFFSSGGPKRREQKTAQLCRQTFQALSLALAECGDDVLRDLILHDVQPAPDASRLLARVGFSASTARPLAAAEVLRRLGEAGGFLRHEAAKAITRKRAPEIFFALIAAGPEEMP